jgi:hypothetical protein
MIAGGVAHVLRKVGLALDGSALAGSGAVRTRTRADSGPHYLRKKEYGMKDRSA